MIKVYGAIDDLIEVEGDIREEFGYHYSESDPTAKFLAFSDGTALKITYGLDDCCWRISVYASNPESNVKHTPATSEDSGYTDVVVIEADIKWVVVGEQFVMKT